MSELKPSDFRPVLAKIQHQTDLGLFKWCEVVYYDEAREGAWKSYSGSKTFEDGEKVIEWIYVDDALKLQADLDESDTEFKNAMQLVKAKNEEIDKLQDEKVELMEFVKKVSELDIEYIEFEIGEAKDTDCLEYLSTDITEDAVELLNKLK